jgi:hypothetical protein
MDIGQGAGLSGASGVRPFLPALLAGALAREDTGIDFDGTSFSFLESPWFLLAVFALAVAAYLRDRAVRPAATPRPGEARAKVTSGRTLPNPLDAAMLLLGAVLGALLFAGSLAAGGTRAGPG